MRKSRSHNNLTKRGEQGAENEEENVEDKGNFRDLVTDLSELEIQQYQGMLLADQLQASA